MNSEEIRRKFREFFEERGHKWVASSSLIPDDPSVLLTTAGMQQFKPYYTGEADPMKDFGSKNTASVQKCFRTSDIDEVGDESHLTFFEMLGNFSFGYKPGEPRSPKGGYWKEEAIKYAYEFITNPDWMGLKVDYVSVFGGDKEIPADEESEKIWKSLGVRDVRKAGREDNFWGPTGAEGPCGPTAEIYVNGVEVWNLVFNEYYKKADGKYEKLETPGIDTGMGLERLAAVLQNKKDVFETDLLQSLFLKISELAPKADLRARRVLTDHLRASAFLAGDSLRPSNKEAGYILRRLLRRILAYQIKYDIHADLFVTAVKIVTAQYGKHYPELKNDKEILGVTEEEQQKFERVIAQGIKGLSKMEKIDAHDAFFLYETFGLPPELTMELAPPEAINFRTEDIKKEFEKHRTISRAGAEKKFGGHGLILNTVELKAGNEEEIKKVTRLHTATHLMNQALHDVLGDVVDQRGSDITPERTRFDFVFPRKLTPEEVKRVENIVNEKIKADLPVRIKEMPVEEALKLGVRKFYKAKYPPVAKVYYIGADDDVKNAYSKEFCGGPHVKRTGEIGKFKIIKEEASSAGVRRIRGTVG